jgi:hypothetical protein
MVTGVLKNVMTTEVIILSFELLFKNFPPWFLVGIWQVTHLSIMRKSLKKGQRFLCHVKPRGAGITVFGPMLEYAFIGPLLQ